MNADTIDIIAFCGLCGILILLGGFGILIENITGSRKPIEKVLVKISIGNENFYVKMNKKLLNEEMIFNESLPNRIKRIDFENFYCDAIPWDTRILIVEIQDDDSEYLKSLNPVKIQTGLWHHARNCSCTGCNSPRENYTRENYG